MSRKHKKRHLLSNEVEQTAKEARREVKDVEVNESEEMRCTDRSGHWQNILIYGQCARCQRAFSPFNPA